MKANRKQVLLRRQIAIISIIAFLVVPFQNFTQAPAAVEFGTAISQNFMRDLILDKLFNQKLILQRMQNRQLDFPGNTIYANATEPQDGLVLIDNWANLNYVIGEGSKSGPLNLYGGSGRAVIDDIHIYVPIQASLIKVEFVNYNKTPALRVMVSSPYFQINQHGTTHIEKDVVGMNVSSTDQQFRGIFEGFNWSGTFKLVNSNQEGKIKLQRITSSSYLNSRVFMGEGVPQDQFLQEYGDRVNNGFKAVMDELFDNAGLLPNGNGQKTIGGLEVTRSLNGLSVKEGALGLTHLVRIQGDEDYEVAACGKNVERNNLDEDITSGALFNFDRGLGTNSVVPFAYIERLMFLEARKGSFCGSSSDGLGRTILTPKGPVTIPAGSIAISPVGKISMTKSGDKVILEVNYEYVHTNSLLFPKPKKGVLKVSRKLKVTSELNTDGVTSQIFLSSVEDKVEGDAMYATKLQAALNAKPLKLALPVAPVMGVFKPSLVADSISVLRRHFTFEFKMIPDEGVKTYQLDPYFDKYLIQSSGQTNLGGGAGGGKLHPTVRQ